MSYSGASMANQIKHARSLLREVAGATEIVATNKRMLVRCINKQAAEFFQINGRADGFRVWIQKGLKPESKFWYAQLDFNY